MEGMAEKTWRIKVAKIYQEETERRKILLALAMEGDIEARKILRKDYRLLFWRHGGQVIIPRNGDHRLNYRLRKFEVAS